MAVVFVSEFGGLATGGMPMGFEPSINDYVISLSSVSNASTVAFDTATTMIRVHTDAICSMCVVATTTGVATTTKKRMAANQTEYFGVKAGQHVAVISNS